MILEMVSNEGFLNRKIDNLYRFLFFVELHWYHFVEYIKTGNVPNIIGYTYDECLLKHKPTGDNANAPERPERLLEIIKTFENFGLLGRCKRIEVFI